MAKPRFLAGLAALASLAAGLNLLVFRQDVFAAPVLVLFGAALAAGLLWVVLQLAPLALHARLEGRSLYGLNSVISALLFLGVCMVLYAFASHWDRSWDLTQEGRRELSGQTIKVLEGMNKEVEAICFFLQIEDELVRVAQDKTIRFLEQCQRHSPFLEVEVLDPQIARARLEGLEISHASTQGTVVLRCGGRQRVITLSGASPRLEERDFTNGLINVLRDAQPKVCFLTGHGERDVIDTDERDGGSLFKVLLEQEAYQTERIAIQLTDPHVPEDCDILVVNGFGLERRARSDLHPKEIAAIQAYLDRGGRLLLLLDPWVPLEHEGARGGQLAPWLEQRYGIILGNDILVSPVSQCAVELSPDPGPYDDAGAMADFRGAFNNGHRITQAFDQKMLLQLTRTVRLAPKLPHGVSGAELLRATPDFYAETDVAMLFRTGQAVKQPEDLDGPVPVAAAVTARGSDDPATAAPRDARVVVVGDSDFAANGQIGVVPGHLNFILNTMAWLSESPELIAIRPTGKEDPPVMLSEADERAIVWISVLGPIQAVVAGGLAVYLLRRKHQ